MAGCVSSSEHKKILNQQSQNKDQRLSFNGVGYIYDSMVRNNKWTNWTMDMDILTHDLTWTALTAVCRNERFRMLEKIDAIIPSGSVLIRLTFVRW